MLERPRDIRSSQKRGPMVDSWGWAALVVAWLTALGGEQPRPEPLGSSCHCNCTCETKVSAVDCPEASWTWELLKILVFLLAGILLATVRVISGFITVFGKVMGLVGDLWSATATTPSLTSSTAPEAAIEGGEDQRVRALRQLAVVRERKAAR